ncbi:MAG: hypothetical protein JOY58_08380 [Solirubrobacterales bacterium]|nr:hypothetical protein [Solirubrobacterales bacterium]MBV9048271.1 hypothetical protein [Solirubrobacterales bacterium]
MPYERTATATILGLRIIYGAGLIAAPERLARRWLGPASGSGPTQVALRALGAREIVLHAGALTTFLSGGAVRRWLIASIVGDLTDVAATALARDGLPDGAAPATLLVGGGSALVTAALAAALTRSQ